jgi:hypothetical protein
MRAHHALHMGARKLSGLLHELLKPTPGELTFVYYS